MAPTLSAALDVPPGPDRPGLDLEGCDASLGPGAPVPRRPPLGAAASTGLGRCRFRATRTPRVELLLSQDFVPQGVLGVGEQEVRPCLQAVPVPGGAPARLDRLARRVSDDDEGGSALQARPRGPETVGTPAAPRPGARPNPREGVQPVSDLEASRTARRARRGGPRTPPLSLRSWGGLGPRGASAAGE